MIKVAIVEDDQQIRDLTVEIIDHYSDLHCVGAYDGAVAFEKNMLSIRPHVVLMDITMPGKNGIECVGTCSLLHPEVAFVMYTSNEDSTQVFSALAAGALGYVVKGGRPDQIVNAVREVHAGGSPMSRQISRLVTRSFLKTEKICPELEKLSGQEKEVLECLDQGLSYKAIANKRFVSQNTIRTQVQSIYRKLHVHSRIGALNVLHGRNREVM